MSESRLWPWVTAASVALAAYSFTFGRRAAPAPPPDAAPAASSAPSARVAAPSASAEPVEPASLLERARAGELDAIKQLELKRPRERTIDESVAIATGHDVLLQLDVIALGRELGSAPERLADPSLLERLHRHALDPSAAKSALGVAARLAAPLGPDLLFAVRNETKHAPTRALAEDLLATGEVQSRASKALLALLRVEDETGCQRLRPLLVRLRDHGDKRALSRLDELEKRTGCGKDEQGDCFECLRDDETLTSARRAVSERPAPRPWVIRRR
ncbi:MAG: hypothetical protein KF718_14325 [Polyangiaceae bacterium]|nr:hypothetical protein [Polyangiaceae bacterium]